MQQQTKKYNIRIILAFAAVYIIWGTTYLAIKIGLKDMPPFIMATCRYLIAGSVLLIYPLLKGQNIFEKGLVRNLLLGCFMLTLGQAIIFWAEQYLDSGLTAVLLATLPVWYIIADRRNWKTNFKSIFTITSIVVGLIGIILLFKDQACAAATSSSSMKMIASFVVIGSCICWALGSLSYKNHAANGSLLIDVGWQLAGGAVSCFFVSLFVGELHGFKFTQVSYETWWAVLYLAIAGSVIAFSASYYLLSVRPASVVGTYAYVNPVGSSVPGLADSR